ncbi:GNAT family N-acetyltransferase [Parvularcula sp. ZS-1/3]|uniref:GNAT family N-acetyltransferase n=1 Tax=Parvularcula mediterranea TaxID=2732508 RepID=A0A7Y3RKG9_9PROT|nr:GNAT family N-acetyltransferase [Parvularcula mediterranea]NNU15330.1 GNAT family N-acetyltransferase [Parvularcula mediterranea]
MSASPKSSVLERHEVTIHYLEQKAPREQTPLPMPARKLALMRAEEPPISFYRFLFNTIGEPHRWISRRYMPDEELQKHIHDPDVHIYVLYTNGSPIGYGEIDNRAQGLSAIKFFGLLPEAQGLGLGRWFFREVTELAWQFRRGRVIIETCSLDNPRALRLYQREGFTIYDQARGLIEWRG